MTLADVTPYDVENIWRWRNCPNVRKYMYDSRYIEYENHIEWFKLNVLEKKNYIFKICKCKEKKPIGVIYYYKFNKNEKSCYWGMYSVPDAPKGAGGILEYEALEYAFQKMGINILYCEVLAFNSPIIKMHEKFFFNNIGIIKRKKIKESGEECEADAILMQLYAEDWKKRPNRIDNIYNRVKKILGCT